MKNNAKEWFEQFYNDQYKAWVLDQIPASMTQAQLDMIQDALNLAQNAHILDVFCGEGRHAIPLAKKGFEVTAIDLYEPFIQTIVKSSAGLNIHPICMDARSINYEKKFDAIILLFTSFGYFSDEENELLMNNLSNALKDDGKILIDIENRDYILKNYLHEKWRNKENGLLLERHAFNPFTSRQKTRRIWIDPKGNQEIYSRNLRLYSAHELIALAGKYHLEIIHKWGNYDKKPFSINTPRMIFTFQKQ